MKPKSRLETVSACVRLVNHGLHFERGWLDRLLGKTPDINTFVSFLSVGTFLCLEESSLSCPQDVSLAANILGTPLGKKAKVSHLLYQSAKQPHIQLVLVPSIFSAGKQTTLVQFGGWERASKKALWRLGRALLES